MSCDKCTHCQDAKRAAQDAANAYQQGTELWHKTFGRVVYWRADLGMTDIHYVYRADDVDEDLITVPGENLTTI